MDKENWINKAIHDDLTEEQASVFEQMLHEDIELKRQYEFEKNIQNKFNHEERKKLKSFFQEQEQSKRVPLWTGWAAAAVLLIAFAWYFRPQQASKENLYLSYYQKFPNVVSPITRGEEVKEDGYTFYEREDFASALEALNSVEGDTARFYKSLCYIELNQDKDAIESLDKRTFQSPLEEYRNWYLALMYIKVEERERAVPMLKELSQADFPLKEKFNVSGIVSYSPIVFDLSGFPL